MAGKPRILVTYGYHLKEKFAIDIGINFRELDLDNVIVARWKGIRGLNRNTQFRRDIGTKYGIDLHDDTPAREWVFQQLDDPAVSAEIGIKYDLVGHMGYERARRLIHSFRKQWNKNRGKKEISESSSFCCDCYYRTYRMHRPCRAKIISLEYLTCLSDITVEEGVYFLRELVKYLQSYG